MEVILESMNAISPSAMGPSFFLLFAPFLVSRDPFSSSSASASSSSLELSFSGFALFFPLVSETANE